MEHFHFLFYPSFSFFFFSLDLSTGLYLLSLKRTETEITYNRLHGTNARVFVAKLRISIARSNGRVRLWKSIFDRTINCLDKRLINIIPNKTKIHFRPQRYSSHYCGNVKMYIASQKILSQISNINFAVYLEFSQAKYFVTRTIVQHLFFSRQASPWLRIPKAICNNYKRL